MLVFQCDQVGGWKCHSEMGKKQRVTRGERHWERTETEGVFMWDVLGNEIGKK